MVFQYLNTGALPTASKDLDNARIINESLIKMPSKFLWAFSLYTLYALRIV